MQEAGAGRDPPQGFGAVTQSPHLWDNLGPGHCPVPISGSDTGAAQGSLETPPSGSFRADKLSWWGIAAPALLFAVGLIFLFVCALRTGSGSQGLRGGNRRIRCFRGSSATTAGDEPARRAGMRDAASHGARPQQSTRRGLLPAKETLNSGCLHPSKTSFIWRLFLLLSPPGRSGARRRVGMEGTDGCRMAPRRGGYGCRSHWLCTYQSPARPEAGEYKNQC